MRIVVTALVLIALAQPSFASEWKRMQNRGYSVMELDMQSISSAGDLKLATIREVFSQPTRLSNGNVYDVRNMLLKINCSRDAAAFYKVKYFYRGSLIHISRISPARIKFLQMDMNTKFAHIICK